MTLIKSSLKSNIIDLLNDLKTNEDQEASIEAFADGLSGIIDDYIKTATITVPIISVQVVPATGTGATTTPTVATIS